ncbi:unnamed protein product, partial [Ixodes hexagonus]
IEERKKKVTTILVVILFSVLTTIIIFVLSLGYRAPKSQPIIMSWCTADSCLEQAALLMESMNRAVRPCQDFYAYVCGNWKPSVDEILISDVAGKMRANLQRENTILLFNGTSSRPSFKRVSATFRACYERGDEDQQSHINELKVFMHERGIPWPLEPPGDKHPLDVLLDLDINWGTPVLFKTRLFSGSSEIIVACAAECDGLGLEVSYTAYKKASRLAPESGALSIFNMAVKEDKVFFMSLARGMCGSPGAPINAMLKNFPPFNEAFQCTAAVG